MGVANVADRVGRLPPEVRWLAPIVAVELFAVVGYYGATAATISDPRYALYPFVWMNVGLWAVLRTRHAPASRRSTLLAGAVAVAYFFVLAWIAGLVSITLGGHLGHSHSHVEGLQVALSAPGWGPRVAYVTESFYAYFVPYRVVGYVALAYLVYARLLDVSGVVASGLLGLFSCLSCSFPLLAAVSAGVVGWSSGLTSAAYGLSVDVSTGVFVLTVVLLAWRPGAR